MARSALRGSTGQAVAQINSTRTPGAAAASLGSLLQPPASPLGRARWLLLAANLALALFALVLLGLAGAEFWPLRLLGGAALACYCAWVVFSYRRESWSPPFLPAEAPLLFLVALGLGNAQGVALGLLYLVVI